MRVPTNDGRKAFGFGLRQEQMERCWKLSLGATRANGSSYGASICHSNLSSGCNSRVCKIMVHFQAQRENREGLETERSRVASFAQASIHNLPGKGTPVVLPLLTGTDGTVQEPSIEYDIQMPAREMRSCTLETNGNNLGVFCECEITTVDIVWNASSATGSRRCV
jgi:hypothetical protein